MTAKKVATRRHDSPDGVDAYPRGTMRAFVALDLEPMSLRRVVRVADRLRMGSGAPSAAWVVPAKMHVTLKFMGALPGDAVDGMGKALQTLAEGKSAPKPCAMRLAAFPSIEDAEIVVVELCDASGGVKRLADKVGKLTAKLGMAEDPRAFRPHVTLARLKRPYDSRRWLRQELVEGVGECHASRITLYRSDPGVDGSTYVPLARFEFAAKGP
jgi:RNA 2',3'-cyclic 3'-phosphodiesterase